MIGKRTLLLIAFLMVLALFVVACGVPEREPEVAQDPVAQATEVPATPTIAPTATSEPTATPEPTAIPPTPTSMAHGPAGCENPVLDVNGEMVGVVGRYLGRHHDGSDTPGEMVASHDPVTGEFVRNVVAVDGPADNFATLLLFMAPEATGRQRLGRYLGFAPECGGHVVQVDVYGLAPTWDLLTNIPAGVNPGDYLVSDAHYDTFFIKNKDDMALFRTKLITDFFV